MQKVLKNDEMYTSLHGLPPPASALSGSDNRVYMASCLRLSTQIQPNGWTSDALGTLSAITPHKKD